MTKHKRQHSDDISRANANDAKEKATNSGVSGSKVANSPMKSPQKKFKSDVRNGKVVESGETDEALNREPSSENGDTVLEDILSVFSKYEHLLPGPERTTMAANYSSSTPYKHVVIPNLINPELLSLVREEILTHLHFTAKQTDIYSVSQTGDLANLSGLPASESESLPSLLKLRNALYSQEFRDFACAITGVNKLSGIKTDMSINSYEKGGHLLTHDDVIGTRSVSFILYLVKGDVEGGWKDEWGGGLRLYNTSVDGIPENEPCLTIPPKWNQMAMFAIQPGKSFHDVEEVYTSEHPRLAISGWFHVPQEGEPGYNPENPSLEQHALSSLQQLTSTSGDKLWPFRPLPKQSEYDFTEDDITFLQQWVNEIYLTPDVVEQLREAMTDESVLQLPDFLNANLAKSLHQYISSQEHLLSNEGWQVVGPPHKQRFRCTRGAIAPDHNLNEYFEHPAFRKWLYHATGLEVVSQRTLTRNFRPGSDYTLATEHTSTSPHLEATLCLSPSALKPKPPKAQGLSTRAMLSAKETGWTNGEFGGYEVYLAPSDEDEADPAVYKTSDGDDGVLLNTDVGWNTFSLVLRDTGVLKFVKYVSRSAWGGRWDVTSEWKVDYDETKQNYDEE